MKVNKTALLNGLKVLDTRVGKIIDLVVFNITNDGCWAKTTNGDCHTWHFFEDLKGDCEITVVLSQFIKTINVCNEEIVFEVVENDDKRKLIVKSGRKKQTISIVDNTIKNIEFPSVDFKPLNDGFLSAVSRVISCASKDESNYVLKSVSVDGDVLSTDGRRLAIESGVCDFEALLPESDMKQIISDFKNSENYYYCDNDTFIIRNEKTIRKIKQIDGTYPNAKRIIPSVENMNGININCVDFLNCIKDFIAVAGADTPLYVDFVNNEVKLSSASDVLKYSDKCECVFDGEFSLCLNPLFLKSAFESFVGDVTVYYSNNASPIVVGDSKCMFIIMPFRSNK